MKKVLSALLVVCIACTILVSLTSCGDDIVGTWYNERYYNGSDIKITLNLEDDGTYVKYTVHDNKQPEFERGTYEFDGNELVCYLNESTRKTRYNYVNGKLENNGYYFTKE